MKNDLPPFAALLAFEAAGRLQSFTRAAEELNVTQAAISRQIRLLEEQLGRPLFIRAHRAVELTGEGRAYLHTVVNALAHLGTATRELKSNQQIPRLSIGADQSMAALWLMPRLAAIRAGLPGTGLRMVVDDNDQRCLGNDVDVALLHGDGNWPTHESALLFPEAISPVCSPAYFAGRSPPRSVADIADELLIDLEDDHWNWINWRQWLTSKGAAAATLPRRLTIASYPLVIDAAKRGLGVALGWHGLIDHDLAAGHLVKVLPKPLTTSAGYHLLWPRSRQPSPEARGFIEWCLGDTRRL
jgi:LysR family glycine cleavage system transcriptional activator